MLEEMPMIREFVGHSFSHSSHEVGDTIMGFHSQMDADNTVRMYYDPEILTVRVFDYADQLINTYEVLYGDDLIVDWQVPDYFDFDIWQDASGQPALLTEIQHSMDVYASGTFKSFTVTFLDINDEAIDKVTIVYGETVEPPIAPPVSGHLHTGWDKDLTSIDRNLVVRPLYEVDTTLDTLFDEILPNRNFTVRHRAPGGDFGSSIFKMDGDKAYIEMAGGYYYLLYEDDKVYGIDEAFWTDEEDYWKGPAINNAFEDAIMVDIFKLEESMLERIAGKYHLLEDYFDTIILASSNDVQQVFIAYEEDEVVITIEWFDPDFDDEPVRLEVVLLDIGTTVVELPEYGESE